MRSMLGPPNVCVRPDANKLCVPVFAIRQCRAGATRNPAVRHAIFEIGGQDGLRRRRSAGQQNDESECR